MNLVFSYGSLVDKFQLEGVPATLDNYYRLGSYGPYPALIADIQKQKTIGAIITLSDAQLLEADSYEGSPDLYYRKELTLITKTKTVTSWVYILRKEHADRG